jgi:diketogulonate reductase-like aldo/keto reductase
MQTAKAGGAEVPILGLGTWPMRGASCVRIVAAALKLGYRHIDTAQMYGNEDDVGAGIVASGVPRGEVFITTKVERESTSAKRMRGSVEESLRSLGVESVDLLLAHWPNPRIPVAETVEALSDMKRRGYARHIGVSNYTVALVEEAVRLSPEPIVVNQIEYHPFLDQSKLIACNRRHGIATTAYSPVARGRVVGHDVIEDIAAVHDKTASQVSLRWLIQQDVIAIPKSSRIERVRENFDIFDFALSDGEMERIFELGGRRHMINDPSSISRWD